MSLSFTGRRDILRSSSIMSRLFLTQRVHTGSSVSTELANPRRCVLLPAPNCPIPDRCAAPYGFHPQMTGRENVHFVARVYGANIRRVVNFVEDFSEIGEYMDVAVNTYSSGMMARIAFALSMAIEFDVYLIDEITAVGDARFQVRCQEAFAARRKNAGLILVSHSMATIKQYCDYGGVIVEGQLIVFDSADKAIEMYNRLNK